MPVVTRSTLGRVEALDGSDGVVVPGVPGRLIVAGVPTTEDSKRGVSVADLYAGSVPVVSGGSEVDALEAGNGGSSIFPGLPAGTFLISWSTPLSRAGSACVSPFFSGSTLTF
jgi:hypothetical protein